MPLSKLVKRLSFDGCLIKQLDGDLTEDESIKLNDIEKVVEVSLMGGKMGQG